MLARRLGASGAALRCARVAPPVTCVLHARRLLSDVTETETAPSAPAAVDNVVADNSSRFLSSRDIFEHTPTVSFLRARLTAAINPPSSSTLSTTPDPHSVLNAAAALLPHPRTLEPFHWNVAGILSKHYIDHAVRAEDLRALADVLAACCLSPRAVAAQTARHNMETVHSIVHRYADWLVNEAMTGDTERVTKVLDAFEAQLVNLSEELGPETRLFLPLATAWALLRVAAGRDGAHDIKLGLPHASTIVAYATNVMAIQEEDLPALQQVVVVMAPEQDTLPSTVEGLGSRLTLFVTRGKIDAVVAMWESYKSIYQNEHPLATADRGEVLARFLAAAHGGKGLKKESDREALVKLGEEVLKAVPKPTPLPVLYTLLSTEGREREDKLQDRQAVVPAIRKTWDAARKEGVVRDLKAYSIYMSLMGKYHNAHGLFAAWDELTADRMCRAAHEAAEGIGPWPPTAMLNLMLSMSFKVGSNAAQLAQDLFRYSLEPESPLEPDLITFNTALHYAASLPNLDQMNEVVQSAGRMGFKPDIVTYTSLVQGLLRAGRPELAKRTIDMMKSRGIEPNERMAAMLVSDLARDGNADGLRRAEFVIRDMRGRGVRSTVPMWTSLIGGYFRGGWEVDGWSAVDRMQRDGLRLGIVGWNMVLRQTSIQPHNATDEVDPAETNPTIRAFREMLAEGTAPNADTYSIVLNALLRSDQPAEVIAEVIHDIDTRGFQTRKSSLASTIHIARRRADGMTAMPIRRGMQGRE